MTLTLRTISLGHIILRKAHPGQLAVFLFMRDSVHRREHIIIEESSNVKLLDRFKNNFVALVLWHIY